MKRTLPWLLALCMLLLAGCTETYPPPAPRSLMDVNHTATADGQLAIAMDPTGAKHILRAVCPTGAANPECTLTYEMTRQGEVGALWYFTPAGGYTFLNPEVTVTDSNVAYLIWQNCPADNLTGRLCSTWYTTSDDMSAHVLPRLCLLAMASVIWLLEPPGPALWMGVYPACGRGIMPGPLFLALAVCCHLW
jgi:hypothetical protein